jgi:PAS domain S-box-containing protein/putative nucleotidyltransferase with HDIG domain
MIMKTSLLPKFSIRSYILIGFTVWTFFVLGMGGINLNLENEHILEIARNEARSNIEKDLLYRRWNTSHGGVYVPVTEKTQPNPYLAVPEREITSPSGRLLTLMNPAYMTRQVFDAQLASGIQAHLTSLKPLNPNNKPDAWEEAALTAFEEEDITEISSVEILDNEEHLRLMRPFITEEGCLKCHANQGYKTGDIRGGISVSIPLSKYAELKTRSQRNLILGFGILWLAGTISLYAFSRHLDRRLTERNQMLQAIQTSEARYRSLFEQSHDAVFILDMEGRHLAANQRAADMLGYTVEEIQDLSVKDTSYEPDASGKVLERILRGEQIPLYERKFRRKDGGVVHAEINVELVKDEEGNPIHIQSVVRDITERKLAEEAIYASNATLSAVFTVSPLAIVVLNMESLIQLWNPAAERIFGWAKEEVIGKPNPIVPDDKVDEYQKFLEHVRAGGSLSEREVVRQRKDGSRITISLSTAPLFDVNGQPRAIMAIVADISERKKAEEELEKSRYLLQESQKLAGIGHYDLDITNGIWESSETLNKLFGIDQDYTFDVAGWLSLVHPNDRERMEIYLTHEVLGQHKSFDMEYRIVRMTDGKTRWMHGLGKLEFDNDGIPTRMIGSIQDITERKQAESIMQARLRLMEYSASHPLPELLQKTLDEVEALTDSSIGFYHFLLPDQKTISLQSWSTRTKNEFCTAQGEGLHYDVDKAGVWVDCIHSGEPVIHNDYASLAHKKGYPEGHAEVRRELVVPVKRGENIVSILGVGNKPQKYTEEDIHAVSLLADLAWDIAERKRAAEVLREREEKLQSIFRAAPVGIGMVVDRVIQEANQTVCNITGYTQEELLGKHSRFLYPSQEEYDWVGSEKYNQINKFGIGTVETRWKRKDGSLCDILLSSVPLDLSDYSKGVTFTALDITERKKVEQSVRNKTEELEVLFSISTHLRSAQTADEMIPMVLGELRRVLATDASAVILYSPDEESFTYALGDGVLASNIGKQFGVENSISGLVLKTRQPYVTENISRDTKRARVVNGAEELGPAVLVPVQSDAELLGVLVCARGKTKNALPFSPSEVQLLTAIGEMVGNALRRAWLYDQAVSRLRHVQALHSVDMAISANLDLTIILDILLNQVTSQLNVDAADILLLDPYSYALEFAASHGFRNKQPQSSVRFGEGLAGWVALNRRMLSVPDLNLSDRLTRRNLLDEGLVSYYGVPLISKGNLLGVLEIFSHNSILAGAEQLDYLETLAIQAAIAIDNAKLFGQLQSSNLELSLAYDATIEGWSRALELRDEETEGHTLRVTEMTMKLAKALGFNEKDFAHIRHGALLHDIGKMGVPDKILLKPGPLDDEEWEVMKKHTVYAFEMLWPITFLRPAIDIPHYHHEKWDGTGYPRGLKGENIPQAARIFAIADVYDALTSDRPYRKAWSKEKAVEYILSQSGMHFQPEIVEAFVKLV